MLEIRVRFPVGPLNRKRRQAAMLPWLLTRRAGAVLSCEFDSRRFRCCPDGETDIISRFERDVPGSIPGRGAVRNGPVVQRPGYPLDVGKIGGSTPPGTIVWECGSVREWPLLAHACTLTLTQERMGYPMGDGNRLEAGRALTGLAGSNPAPSARAWMAWMVFVV